MSDETFRWIIAAGVAIATISMVVLAATLLVLFRVVSRVQAKVERLGDKAEPMVESIQSLVRENAPRIGHIMTSTAETAENAKDISVVAKDQAHRFAEVGRDIT